jgi:hypothetical protein
MNIRNGKPLQFFKQYRILGDDIVIFNTEVAQRYQWLLEKIGLKINLSKSIIGDRENYQIEFAKRLSLIGKEMSSIRHNILSKNDIPSMLDLIEILHKRDFISPDTGHYGLSQVLKSEDLRRFQFMLWLRTSLKPELEIQYGNFTLKFNREEVMHRIMSQRSANITEKAMDMLLFNIQPLDMETEFPQLVEGFNSIGVSCNAKTLADISEESLVDSHPVVLALDQTSKELQTLLFTALDDLEPSAVPPVEYLPVISSKAYYTSRNTVNRYLCEMLLACYEETLDEQRPK